MIVWRIATAARTFRPDDLTGAGAALDPGRWNDDGVPILYAAENRSLAMLETLVHVSPGDLPQNRYLVEIDVPEPVWDARERLDRKQADDMVSTWDAVPAAGSSVAYGSRWAREGRSTVLCVPSVLVPEETVVLLNPARVRPDGVTARVVRKVQYEVARPRHAN